MYLTGAITLQAVPEQIAAITTVSNRPAGVDLEVSWIERTPMYQRYVLDYVGGKPVLHAGTENARRWPTNSEVVTFTAHLANKGSVASGPFSVRWYVDDVLSASSTHPGLAADSQDTNVFQWMWAHQLDATGQQLLDDHRLACVLDEEKAVAETFENNNRLEESTAAWSLQFIITPAMYDAYSQPNAGFMPFSAEYWIQRQMIAMNTNFARSVYAVTPNGPGVSVRVGQILVASNNNASSTAFDGGWFVNADYRHGASGGYEASTDIDWSLVHELSHQVGLIDNYNYNITSDSLQVNGLEDLPVNFSYEWPRPDLMGGGDIAPYTDGHIYSSWTACGAMVTRGFRRGYYGEYQFDIPRQNFLRVLDNLGQPAPGVTVSLYQRGSGGDIDNAAEITGVTDTLGIFWLTNRNIGGAITTCTAHVEQDNPFGIVDVVGPKNSFLARLVKDTHEEFLWLNVSAFNLAYWAGNTETNIMTLISHVPPSSALAPPRGVTARVEGRTVKLCWPPVSGAVSYRVYAARRPEYRYQLLASGLASTCWTTTTHSETRVYVVTAVNSDGRESGFSVGYWAPLLVNPTAVATASDGQRIILDPQNGHALLEQRYDGRYFRNIGSVHYHLENSKYFCLDESDRMILSHPGDWYTSRQSVRIATRLAEALSEFGQTGSGLGQFQTPAGVAVSGKESTYTAPLVDDSHTLLLLHFETNVVGAAGETGSGSGYTFGTGKFGGGISLNDPATLYYPTAGNMLRESGAVEFWFQPSWSGANTTARYFFIMGAPFNNGLQLVKDGANNIRLMMWRGSQEFGVGYNITSWQAGEWHHVAATWSSNQIALYTDGLQRASSTNVGLPNQLASNLYIGSTSGGNSDAAGILDEFRISDIPRVGNSDVAGYTIFVADSGNHRIQSFRLDGSFLASFGSYGASLGQFNSPQGLAMDAASRLLVADRMNNRVQVFSITGTNSTVLGALTGLNQPRGVASWQDTHWIVADSGNNQVKIFDTNFTLLTAFAAPNDGSTGNFRTPQGVSTDRNGDILVADTGNARLVTIKGQLSTNVPPQFVTPRVLPNGVFSFRLLGPQGRDILLQKSTDLFLWGNVATISMETNYFDYTAKPGDTNPFYRALLLP